MTNFASNIIDMRFNTRKPGIALLTLVIITSGFFAACKTEKRPDDILSKEQLSAIMIEIYLAESRLNGLSLSKDSATLLFIPFEDSLLKRAGVSEVTLRKSYQYYFDHPEELERVYDIVIDSLNLRDQKASAREGIVK